MWDVKDTMKDVRLYTDIIYQPNADAIGFNDLKQKVTNIFLIRLTIV